MANFRLLRAGHSETGTQDGRKGTKTFIDRGGLLDQPRIGDPFDDDPSNALNIARSVVKEPYGNDGANDRFKFIVQYNTTPPTEDGEAEDEVDSEDLNNNGDMSSEWLELTSEKTSHRFTWLSDGAVIVEKKIRRRIIRQSLRITQTRDELDFTFWRKKLNKVNSAVFRGIPVEGWLFIAAPWREIRRNNGAKAFRFELQFEMKQIEDANNLGTFFGWNHVYRSETGLFDKPNDNNGKLVYEPTAFEGPGEILG